MLFEKKRHTLTMGYYYRQMQKLNQHMQNRVTQALLLIDAAVAEYKLDAVFALVSGGDGSTAMMHIAMMHPRFAGVIHLDTLTGITDSASWKTGQPDAIATRFVRDYACRLGVELIIQKPYTTYEMLIAKNGFPGPGMHANMYQFLKERPLRQAKKQSYKIAASRKIGFVGGVSRFDSVRRMGTADAYRKDKEGIWVNPLYHWTSYDTKLLQAQLDINRNPVSVDFGMSGECGCGAYATPDEANVIRHLYPEQSARIEQWESVVKAVAPLSGIHSKYCRWGHADGKRISENQMSLPLCKSCIGQQTGRALSMRKKNGELESA